jgi:3-oxoacyl-[acyl-carrier-protein] synthase II
MTTVRRVAITGIGLCTPLGNDTETTWSALVEGRSAVGPIRSYDATSLQTRIGAEVDGLEPRDFVANRRSLRTMTRHDIYAMVAAKGAIEDSGVDLGEDPEGRNALFTAGDKQVSDPDYFAESSVAARDANGKADVRQFGELAYSSVHPLFYLEGIQGASLFYISEQWGLRGPNTYFSGTAEAGLLAVARGYRAVRRGEAELALCGASDSPIFWWHMAAWDSFGVLTTRNDLGAGACAPYDAERDGTVMGEGAAFLLVEDLDAARARGATIYAEIVGAGAAVDTGSLSSPDASGRAVTAAAERALRAGRLAASEVGYVATHGDGTRQGDACEAAGLRQAFGDDGLLASSVKPATGNLVGAAGALNIAVAALALSRQTVPPTLNLEHMDPACAGIDWIAKEAREAQPVVALALARGLEGQNVTLALRAA